MKGIYSENSSARAAKELIVFSFSYNVVYKLSIGIVFSPKRKC